MLSSFSPLEISSWIGRVHGSVKSTRFPTACKLHFVPQKGDTLVTTGHPLFRFNERSLIRAFKIDAFLFRVRGETNREVDHVR